MDRKAQQECKKMEYDLKSINQFYIKPLVAVLILAGYYAGLFSAPF
jgi:hypothetical protein